jgi:hypothetical protein
MNDWSLTIMRLGHWLGETMKDDSAVDDNDEHSHKMIDECTISR